jgi:hypothetical protein
MGRTAKVLMVSAATAAGVMVVRRKRQQNTAEVTRRHAITANRPIDEVSTDGQLPRPLAELGDGIELEMRPAPGDRGTEIYVRSRGTVSEGAIREALRETRSLLEAGDVLRPDKPTTKPTVLNKALRKTTQHGREGGLS